MNGDTGILRKLFNSDNGKSGQMLVASMNHDEVVGVASGDMNVYSKIELQKIEEEANRVARFDFFSTCYSSMLRWGLRSSL